MGTDGVNGSGARAPADLRIGIVGAGPAGLTLAWYLHTLGLRSVHLFEAGDHVGGQSVTLDVGGVPVELGTCYLTTGYGIVRDLAARVGCPAEVLPPATVLDARGRPVDRAKVAPGPLSGFVRHWLRWYLRGQLWRPTDPDNALPFPEWLERRALGALAREFTFAAGLTAQLYGPLGDVTAHSALTWLRPSLFLTGELGLTASIPAGFQTLWRRLAEHLAFPVHLRARVDAVQPRAGRVELLRDGEQVSAPFDHVFVACAPDDLAHPLTATLRDVGPFASTGVYSAIWRGTGWPTCAASRCYLASSFTGERGRLLTIRRNGTTSGREVGQLCAYGIAGKTLEEHRALCAADARELVGLSDLEILHDRLWRYNIRYSAAQLRQGLPARIDRAQGEQNVWYTGGALSHWNVDSIVDGNHRLALRFARRAGLARWRRLRLLQRGGLLRDL